MDSDRIAIFLQTPPRIQAFYSAPTTATSVLGICQKYQLSERELALYSELVGDIILNIESMDMIPHTLRTKGFGDQKIEDLTAATRNLLAPITPPAAAGQAQPEHKSTVSALRTMEGDVERVHGYGAYRDIHPTGDNTGATTMSSSQDDLLGNRLANTPRYTDS